MCFKSSLVLLVLKSLPCRIPAMALDYSSLHLHKEAYSSPQTESGLQMFVSQ